MIYIKTTGIEQTYLVSMNEVYYGQTDGHPWATIKVRDPYRPNAYAKMLVYPEQIEEIKQFRGLAKITSIIVKLGAKPDSGTWKPVTVVYAVIAPISDTDVRTVESAEIVRKVVERDILRALDDIPETRPDRRDIRPEQILPFAGDDLNEEDEYNG